MGLHLLACSARALRHKSARIAVFADRRPRDDKKRPATQRNLENEKLISIVERHRKERNRESEKKKKSPAAVYQESYQRLKGAVFTQVLHWARVGCVLEKLSD